MAKNILKRQFANMYSKDKATPGKNSIETLLKSMNGENLKAAENSNQVKRVIKNEFSNTYNSNKNMLPELKPTNITVSAIIFITVLVILATIIYYYRNEIMKYFKDKTPEIPKVDPSIIEHKYDALFDGINKKLQEDDKELSEIKQKLNKREELDKKQELDNIEKKEKEKKEKESKIVSGGVGTLNSKLETKYKNNQIVKGNGYCYIGFDNHMRECTDVYDGDICMSGQIFPTLEVCLNPEFRP